MYAFIQNFAYNQFDILQRLNNISATLRETQTPEDTPEKLEEERLAAQEFIDTGAYFSQKLTTC